MYIYAMRIKQLLCGCIVIDAAGPAATRSRLLALLFYAFQERSACGRTVYPLKLTRNGLPIVV